jgi:hypothetical protein
MMHQVFISYANDKGRQDNRDFKVAETICNALEAKSIRCWMAPRDIKGGDDWTEEIPRAVKESRLVVLVFSSNANQSDGVKDEIHLARDKKIRIIPFRIENVPATGVLEFVILRYQCIDAFKAQPQDHMDKLIKAVQEHLGDTTPPPQPQKLLPNPFIDTMAIHDPARFIGREAEMRRLMTLLQGGKLGKAHFFVTWPAPGMERCWGPWIASH